MIRAAAATELLVSEPWHSVHPGNIVLRTLHRVRHGPICSAIPLMQLISDTLRWLSGVTHCVHKYLLCAVLWFHPDVRQ